MLAAQPREQMEKITKLIPSSLLEAPHLQQLLNETKEEILSDYELSLRKAISKLSALLVFYHVTSHMTLLGFFFVRPLAWLGSLKRELSHLLLTVCLAG